MLPFVNSSFSSKKRTGVINCIHNAHDPAIMQATSLSWLTETLKTKRTIVDLISYTCVSRAMTK